MLKFKMATTIEFKDMESLEVFIKALPIPLEKQLDLLDGEVVTDDQDQAEAVGAGRTLHEFSWEGSE